MDKLNKTYNEFFKQVIPESPLKEAFRKWRETTKIIKESKQNEKKWRNIRKWILYLIIRNRKNE